MQVSLHLYNPDELKNRRAFPDLVSCLQFLKSHPESAGSPGKDTTMMRLKSQDYSLASVDWYLISDEIRISKKQPFIEFNAGLVKAALDLNWRNVMLTMLFARKGTLP